MVGQLLEITRSGVSVHKHHGFLVVKENGVETGRIGIENIEAVLVSSPGVMWSNTALAELATRQIPVMILGPSFSPVSVFLPLIGHHVQAERFRAQAEAKLPLRKRAWASLVRQKIAAQAEALDRIGESSARLRRLMKSVRSGDPNNHEAQAAQVYWPLLMGAGFKRERQEAGANALLNYGYTVLRAATARAIVSAGLHPSLSLHHRSGGDALALADDLMEPFRPTVDLTVHRLIASGVFEVADAREDLVDCLSADFATQFGASPLSHVLLRLAQNLAQSFLIGEPRLDFPSSPLPNVDPGQSGA